MRAALGLLALCLVTAACGGSSHPRSGVTPPPTGGGPPALQTGPAPWPLGSDQVARIAAAGLPALPSESLRVHYHAHLDVLVDGQAVTVPALVGIDVRRQVLSPLHTHDQRGVLHVESPNNPDFTLGQFFTEWGVRFSANCVGGYCAPDHPVSVYVNGEPRPGDPAAVRLAPHQEIAVVVGKAPPAVPASFSFAPGE